MGLSTKERRARILDLLNTVDGCGSTGANRKALVGAAVRSWGVAKRTAEEYIQVLEDAQWVTAELGGVLRINERGKAALVKPPELGQGKPLDTGSDEPAIVIKPVPRTSPPTSTTGGEVEIHGRLAEERVPDST